MRDLTPVELQGHGVVLEPLRADHEAALTEAATDGRLWELWFTYVPAPDETAAYIQSALAEQRAGTMLPWVVRDATTGRVVGSTRYYDIVTPIDRVELGYTWYAKSVQRSHVNTACKLLLLQHAFDTLRCQVVGFRTDGANYRSQRAIEALGARWDGRVRHHGVRKDGTARDNVFYSILAHEWADVRRHLGMRVRRLVAGEIR